MAKGLDKLIFDPSLEQQPDFFEIQEKLKKKKEENKTSSEEEILDVDLGSDSDSDSSSDEVDKASEKVDEAASQLAKYADAYKKISANSAAIKPKAGANLMGATRSMNPFGALGKVEQSTSPYFASQGALTNAKFKDINNKIQTLRKILQGGVNV
tara:strand:+ start:220 stop:684 length:465 start_codon:yes stop_codon:yes gene_type:complete